MTKKELIGRIAEHYDIERNADFADYFGIPRQNAVYWLRGGYDIYAVYQKCPEINPEWLLSGGEVGEMLRPAKPEPSAMHEDCKQLLDKSLDNMKDALARISEEQAISKQVLSQTDKVLELVRDAKG